MKTDRHCRPTAASVRDGWMLIYQKGSKAVNIWYQDGYYCINFDNGPVYKFTDFDYCRFATEAVVEGRKPVGAL